MRFEKYKKQDLVKRLRAACYCVCKAIKPKSYSFDLTRYPVSGATHLTHLPF